MLDRDALELLRNLRLEAEEFCTLADGSWHPRAVAAHFVESLLQLEGSGHPWVAEYLANLTITGAYEKLRDDRRMTAEGFSRRGHLLPESLPSFDAHGNAVRVPIAKARRADVARALAEARQSYGAALDRVRVLSDLLARMDAAGVDVVGLLSREEVAA